MKKTLFWGGLLVGLIALGFYALNKFHVDLSLSNATKSFVRQSAQEVLNAPKNIMNKVKENIPLPSMPKSPSLPMMDETSALPVQHRNPEVSSLSVIPAVSTLPVQQRKPEDSSVSVVPVQPVVSVLPTTVKTMGANAMGAISPF